MGIAADSFRHAYESLIDFADRLFGPAPSIRSYVGQDAFPRTLQLNSYTCAPCAVYMVLRHFGLSARLPSIEKALRTDRDGTDTGPMLSYLRQRGLIARAGWMSARELKHELARGALVIAFLDGDHVGVVYGADHAHVFVADPAPNRSLFSGISRSAFHARWERHGIAVRPRRRRCA